MEKGLNNNLLPSNHWTHHARQWSFVGSPLRPSDEDTGVALNSIREWISKTNQPDITALILGVTPEFCVLPLSDNSQVIAVDNSPDMIKAIWPGKLRLGDKVLCADWRHLPIEDCSVDIVLGDGGLSALPFPTSYLDLCAEVRRVLVKGGRFIIRCFVHPDKQENLEEIFLDLSNKNIGNFHILKWRLAMALQESAEVGVAVGAVWTSLNAQWNDLNLLAKHCNWPVEEVYTVEAYRGVETRYSFPTLAQYSQIFLDSGFSIAQIITPSYEIGDRCPTFVLDLTDK